MSDTVRALVQVAGGAAAGEQQQQRQQQPPPQLNAHPAAALPAFTYGLGGSLGSALALLLLYPLERARIEMQAAAARSRKRTATTTTAQRHQHRPHQQQHEREKSKPPIQLPPESARGSDDDDGDDDGSWEPLLSHESSDSSEDSSARSSDSSNNASSRGLQQHQQHRGDDIDEDGTTTHGLIQCFRRLFRRNELYRGVRPIVSTLAISNFIFFYFNAVMKRIVAARRLRRRPNPPPPGAGSASGNNSYLQLLASCLAGILNVLLTNPLWVTNLQIVTGQAESSNILAEMKRIAREDGIGHLWSGTSTSILLVSNPVIQFFFYEEIRSLLLSRKRRRGGTGRDAVNLAPIEAFVAGALAKAVATLLTYPLQLAQAVLRLQHRACEASSSENDSVEDDDGTRDSKSGGKKRKKPVCEVQYHGTFDCLVKLYKRDGPGGLFTGMRAKLLQTVLTAAFTFLTYEQILKAIHATHLALARSRRKRT